MSAESGFDLAQELHRADPLVPQVILISTHDEVPRGDDRQLCGGIPAQLRALAEAIRAPVDGAAPSDKP